MFLIEKFIFYLEKKNIFVFGFGFVFIFLFQFSVQFGFKLLYTMKKRDQSKNEWILLFLFIFVCFAFEIFIATNVFLIKWFKCRVMSIGDCDRTSEWVGYSPIHSLKSFCYKICDFNYWSPRAIIKCFGDNYNYIYLRKLVAPMSSLCIYISVTLYGYHVYVIDVKFPMLGI